MRCKVCRSESNGKYSQCRKCGTIDCPVSFWRRLNIFGRIADLELQNRKQAAVIMKLCKKLEEKEKPFPVEESGWCETAEEYIDYVLGAALVCQTEERKEDGSDEPKAERR